jgi:SAM-dependent methyltransferase
MDILFIIFVCVLFVFGFVVFWGAPYVPSHKKEVQQAFRELYKLTPKDVVVDVGSGDGIILRLASKLGARAIGYELNPVLVAVSRFLSRGDKKVTVQLADFWQKDIADSATLVYAFVVSRDTNKLAEKMQREANRLHRPLYLMTYGASLDNLVSMRKRRGHHLYEFVPLQTDKA